MVRQGHWITDSDTCISFQAGNVSFIFGKGECSSLEKFTSKEPGQDSVSFCCPSYKYPCILTSPPPGQVISFCNMANASLCDLGLPVIHCQSLLMSLTFYLLPLLPTTTHLSFYHIILFWTHPFQALLLSLSPHLVCSIELG